MKVAFVNQPIDTILPPNQNSVGSCTYGVAKALSRYCDIVLFGRKDAQDALEPGPRDMLLRCCFVDSSPVDCYVYEAMRKYRRIVRRASLLSVSDYFYPSYARRVAQALRDEDCDVIHVQHSSQYLPVIRRFNPHARIVLQMHSEWFSQSSRAVFLERVRRADLVTGVSRYVVEKTRRDFPEIADRCRVFRNGIDAEDFRTEKDYAEGRSRGVKRILYAGTVSPHRGLHVLMRAFNLLARRCPNVHLDIVGPDVLYPLFEIVDRRDKQTLAGLSPFYSSEAWSLLHRKLFGSRRHPDYGDQLKAMLDPESAGKVSFHGFVGDRELLLKHFRAADVFVFPSVCNDSFGIPVAEAMASGLPVVASRSGGVIEVVQDGISGTVVEKNDEKALSNALMAYIEDDDLREKAGRAGRQRVLGAFTWERAAEVMLAEYCGIGVGNRDVATCRT